MIVKLADVRMRKRLHALNFSLDSASLAGVVQFVLRVDFDGNALL